MEMVEKYEEGRDVYIKIVEIPCQGEWPREVISNIEKKAPHVTGETVGGRSMCPTGYYMAKILYEEAKEIARGLAGRTYQRWIGNIPAPFWMSRGIVVPLMEDGYGNSQIVIKEGVPGIVWRGHSHRGFPGDLYRWEIACYLAIFGPPPGESYERQEDIFINSALAWEM
jgi:hypothetical protein